MLWGLVPFEGNPALFACVPHSPSQSRLSLPCRFPPSPAPVSSKPNHYKTRNFKTPVTHKTHKKLTTNECRGVGINIGIVYAFYNGYLKIDADDLGEGRQGRSVMLGDVVAEVETTREIKYIKNRKRSLSSSNLKSNRNDQKQHSSLGAHVFLGTRFCTFPSVHKQTFPSEMNVVRVVCILRKHHPAILQTGGHAPLIHENLMPSLMLFVLTWVIVYTTMHFESAAPTE